jgi:hypothetical protein
MNGVTAIVITLGCCAAYAYAKDHILTGGVGTDIYGLGPDISPPADEDRVYNPFYDAVTRRCRCNQCLVKATREQLEPAPKDTYLKMMQDYRKSSQGVLTSLIGIVERPKCSSCSGGGQNPNFHTF